MGRLTEGFEGSVYKRMVLLMGVILLVASVLLGRESAKYLLPTMGQTVNAYEEEENALLKDASKKPKYKVVLDAGHGGFDPGKIGVNGALEKDINLQIARLMKYYLEEAGVEVVMTRQTDEGLYEPDSSNKKVQDMKNRIEVIEKEKPDVTVSIHQNSFPEETVKGAQVFYYETSKEGIKLAELIQSNLKEKADPSNKRQKKPNNSYYLLKKTGGTIVIVECGFLSNNEEARRLCSEEYQQRVAWSVSIAVLQYLKMEVF